MKRLLLSFVVAFVLLVANAQNKLSLYTQSFLHHCETSSIEKSKSNRIEGRASKMFVKSVKENGIERVGAFITLDDETKIDDIEALGVIINRSFGKILTVQIPIDKIEAVAELGNVKRISVAKPMKIRNDVARSKTSADIVQAGTGLKQPYTGKGVVVGIVDTGIEVNHINFMDKDGNSRVKRVYFPEDETGDSPVIDGTALPGSEYVTPGSIARLTTDTETESHGTHTSGTAAGGYKTSCVYYGMAPESDMVLCGMSGLADVDIANSVAYIFNYANSVGKPAVVNMSLGGHFGSHDGSSEICYIFDSMSKKGNIMVMSAGNEGDTKLHIYKKFEKSNSTDVQFKTILSDTYNDGDSYDGAVIDVWGRTDAKIGIQFFVVNAQTNAVLLTSKKFTPSSTEGSWSWSSLSDSNLKKYYQGEISVSAGIQQNNKYNMLVEINANSQSSGKYYIGVQFYGNQGTEMDMWDADGYVDFISNGSSNFTQGDSKCSINEMATGNKTISVGAYGSKKSFMGVTGTSWSANSCKVDDIAPFSSYGPDINGIRRPDIVGPGFSLVSSVNGYDIATTVNNHDYLIKEEEKNGHKYYWADMAGTSMSSPAVAGIIALWLQANPTLDVDEIKDIFKVTAIKDSYVTEGNPDKWGFGKIDALGGIIQAINTGVESVSSDRNVVFLYPNPSNGQFSVFAQNETGNMKLGIYTTSGSLVYSKSLELSEGQVNVNLNGALPSGLYIVRLKGDITNYSSLFEIK